MSGHDDPLAQAAAWLESGRGVALATVVGTWGSSPRPVGSMLAVADDGAFVGSVSGGCIEGAVVKEALDVIAAGPPRLLDYGITDERAWEVGLACGGEMKVFVERSEGPAFLGDLLSDRPLALVTHLETGAHAVVRQETASGSLSLGAEALAAARRALGDGRSTMVEDTAGPLFVGVLDAPLRLIIVGAVHIAQSLAPMAAMAGFAVTVVDPRRAFATGERFPGVAVSGDWPDEAMRSLAPDARTAVVTLTHDPKLDDPALDTALRSDCFYIGALGSRRTHGKRLDRLRAEGFDEDTLARIHGPIGLDLGGRKAEEIAVAILAEVVATRHGRKRTA